MWFLVNKSFMKPTPWTFIRKTVDDGQITTKRTKVDRFKMKESKGRFRFVAAIFSSYCAHFIRLFDHTIQTGPPYMRKII
mmetsp:Transcript_16291/g.30847  ORF Transcript_16291/g.30847 Transcript_16291/m.30847 type:complete len:80 (-) Transcript_16291:191-430(-)